MEPLKYVEMTRDLGPVGQGGASSHYMSSEDGSEYVVKFKENDQNIRVLVNELIANRIAQFLQLPCPQGIVADINEMMLQEMPIKLNRGATVSPGLHFGSVRKIGYQKPPRRLISTATNKSIFPRILLFDILTFNHNRNNDGNFLIVSGEEEGVCNFYIIDHGHCFGNPKWDINLKNKVGTWNTNALNEVVSGIEGTDPFKNDIERIKSLDNDTISKFVEEVPDEWGVNADERTVLKQFLKGQRDRIEEIVRNHKNMFPKWQ